MLPTSAVYTTFLLFATASHALLLPGFDSLFSLINYLPFQSNNKQTYLKQDEVNYEEYKAKLISNKFKKIVPDHYIVVLKDGLSKSTLMQHTNWVSNEYATMMTAATESAGVFSNSKPQLMKALEFFQVDNFISGYMGYFTKDMIQRVMQNPDVDFVEEDSIFKVNEFDVQKNAPWGISRISRRENLTGGGGADSDSKYLFDNEGGKGVVAYVVDTGIMVEHEDFEGRAVWGEAVAFPKIKKDGNGHGTHCAGIIGSKTYGIAKSVDLVAVGVMNLLGAGSTSDILKGIEYVVNQHQNDVRTKKKGFKGSVINMSLGGGASDALDLAVNAAVRAGVHVAVAAGNDNADACDYSPAKADGPITVGASSIVDARASFSNWGTCVDIIAPGENIDSTYIWSDHTAMSGTSMAAPHVAGLLSYYLSLQPEQTSEYYTLVEPADLKKRLLKYGTKGVLTDVQGSPNILAYNGAGGNLTEFWSN
ncbi:serine protease [Lodderomyces elongisporus]|uniref:serine protease n=1 Tax=Lodderomyces elongisporus TaxID=36914 RepID=UPI00291E1865|nr:serine protease [Lodderomyces elongisporus]WLF79507.1 serine protease [Lodderomyces elongisporus]